MQTRQDRIEVGSGPAAGDKFDAYVSIPDTPNGRAVIVLQEIFGVTPQIREVADRYAKEGYLAIAPDLYWRVEPGLSLSHSKEDIARAFNILESFSDDDAIADIAVTIAHARRQPGITKVAVVGMCLGGKLGYLAAARVPVDAVIAFYGVGIEKHLDEASNIEAPLRMYFGAKDKYVSPETRDQVAAAVRHRRAVDVVVVDGADHGFYTRGDPAVLANAHREALGFFDAHMAAEGAAA
ncbi:dienelactone hydrolase family protein [soil metagenome]